MSSPVLVIAKNTFKEMIRDRVLYFVLVFSVLFMGLCFALGQLSYDEIFRLSVSLGLGGIHLCFMGLAIFLGCSVFFKEIEQKTIYTLLARPLSREQYLFGKYLGLGALLFVLLMGFVACFTVVELLLGMPILVTSYYAFIGFFFEAALVLAMAFFFSSFAKPFLAITGSLSLFLVGHWIAGLDELIRKSDNLGFKLVGAFLQKIIPDLEMLNWRDFAVAQAHVSFYEIIYSSVIALLWLSLFFLLSVLIFRRRDFE